PHMLSRVSRASSVEPGVPPSRQPPAVTHVGYRESPAVVLLHGAVLDPAAWNSAVERVTRIELALSAWEVERSRLTMVPTSQLWWSGVAGSAPSSPWLMAR